MEWLQEKETVTVTRKNLKKKKKDKKETREMKQLGVFL